MRKILVPLLVSTGLLVSSPSWSEEPAQRWTLGASIQRAVEVAPEMKMADAEIGKQQSKLQQADAWPNPRISIQLDESLGIENASGGFTVSQFEIIQPLPVARLKHQRTQAQAKFASVEAQRRYQQLLLEYNVAQRFHALQLTEAKLQLAQKRLQQASRYQHNGRKQTASDFLIRYLTPLENMRLDLVLQAAKQNEEIAEGEYNEAAASFKALLNISIASELQQMRLTTVAAPAELPVMQGYLNDHPLIITDKKLLASAQAGIDVAKATRFDDPTISIFQEQVTSGTGREESLGFKFSFQVPLWHQNKAQVTQARYAVHQARAELNLRQRELKSDLHKSYVHLGHLIKQAEHYRIKLLQPAKKVFTLTRQGFDAGELNILTLIDANNTYFDTQERYLELLQQGWMELAEVRKSAGFFVANNAPVYNFGEVK